jgi:hypothetical protein
MHVAHHHHVVRAINPASVPAISLEESDKIRRTLGSTPIYILRQSYGAGFAPGTPGDVTLGEAMDHIDNSSLTLLARRLAQRAADELNRM